MIHFILWAVSFAAMTTHIVAMLMAKAYAALIVGVLLAPIGIVHGASLWLPDFSKPGIVEQQFNLDKPSVNQLMRNYDETPGSYSGRR